MGRGPNSYISGAKRQLIMARPCCEYCGTIWGPFHIDHIVPPKIGGDSSLKNLAKACQSCNASKGDFSIDGWLSHLKGKRDKNHSVTIGFMNRHRWQKKRNTVDSWVVDKLEHGIKLHRKYCRMIHSLTDLIAWRLEESLHG